MIEQHLDKSLEDHEVKCKEVLQAATELFEEGPDWATFFREVLGIDGLMRRAFPDSESLARFEQSTQYGAIQQMLLKLRQSTTLPPDGQEPIRVITIRLPKSLHEVIRAEAQERQISMNKLCISKLLQVVDGELVPVETA